MIPSRGNLNTVQKKYVTCVSHLLSLALCFFSSSVAWIHCSVFTIQWHMNRHRIAELYGVCITLSDDRISIVFAIVSRDPFIYLQFHNIIMFRSNIHFNGRYMDSILFFTWYSHKNSTMFPISYVPHHRPTVFHRSL